MKSFVQAIEENASLIQKVIDFDPSKDKLLAFDLTANNKDLTIELIKDTDLFTNWANNLLLQNKARYGIGGYGENRVIYAMSSHFDAEQEPRRLHLGIDIWAPAETPIYNFFDAQVHSFANNNNFGDYGGTIILKYNISGFEFYALFGHLNPASLDNLTVGQFIPSGQKIATLGTKLENGYWAPHLHFQLINNMQGLKGDYPGVCKYSEKEKYLQNCPDPNLILKYNFNL